jgi:hypothetical protein
VNSNCGKKPLREYENNCPMEGIKQPEIKRIKTTCPNLLDNANSINTFPFSNIIYKPNNYSTVTDFARLRG